MPPRYAQISFRVAPSPASRQASVRRFGPTLRSTRDSTPVLKLDAEQRRALGAL
jgi:hypothetical protein